jgi:predicted PurR-regulated permease PerM
VEQTWPQEMPAGDEVTTPVPVPTFSTASSLGKGFGIVGLFLGAVVFTLGYGLLLMWLNPEEWPRSPGKDGG